MEQKIIRKGKFVEAEIQISEKTLARLEKQKEYPEEPLNDVIVRLITNFVEKHC